MVLSWRKMSAHPAQVLMGISVLVSLVTAAMAAASASVFVADVMATDATGAGTAVYTRGGVSFSPIGFQDNIYTLISAAIYDKVLVKVKLYLIVSGLWLPLWLPLDAGCTHP